MKKFGSYVAEKNIFEFCQEPLFYQSEYFNVYFQKSVEEFKNHLDLHNILVISAQEVSFSQFSKQFKSRSKYSVEDRKKTVENYFASCGFGKVDLTPLQAKGGYVIAESEHYAKAWVKYFGKRTDVESGVCYFTLGFLTGAVEAIFDVEPGSFTGIQLDCISKGDDVCKFEIYRGLKRKINASPALGKENKVLVEDTNIANPFTHALTDLDLDGRRSEDGLIHAFDSTFTKHYTNYLALVSIKLLMLSNKKIGPAGFKKAKQVISSVAEENVYFTIGKILNSGEWTKLLTKYPELGGQSHLKNAVDVQTAFGLGNWDLIQGEVNHIKVRIANSPLTSAYLKLVGNTKAAIGYYQTATLRAIGNLVNKGFVADGDVDLNYIDKYKGSQNNYQCGEEQSRMVGHDYDLITAKPK